VEDNNVQESNSQGWQKQVVDIGYTLFRQLWIKNRKKSDQTAGKLFTKCVQGNFRWVAHHFVQSVAINFYHKSPHFSLLSSTSPCELYEREGTFSSNLKVVRVLKCLSESDFFLFFIHNCLNKVYPMSTTCFCQPWLLDSCTYVTPSPFWSITVLWSNTTKIVITYICVVLKRRKMYLPMFSKIQL
jgi:hypothetical protein